MVDVVHWLLHFATLALLFKPPGSIPHCYTFCSANHALSIS
jgi:hypothetical protein